MTEQGLDIRPVKLHLRHELPSSPLAFWGLFLDSDATERMYREALGATAFEVRSLDGDLTSGLAREIHSEQPIDAPGPIKKIMGSSTGSAEAGTWDPTSELWTFTMRPDTMGDKVRLGGTMRAEATADGCVRIFEMEASVKILGLGKVFESFIERQARDAQDATAAWLREALSV